jgi:hypothetical protein
MHAMRTFFRDHWKALVAIVLLVLLALFTVSPTAALPEPSLAARLRTHVAAIAPHEHGAATPAELETAARYIENALATEGYRVRRQARIEASISNVAPHAKPARIFIVGAHYDPAGAGDNGSGAAAVLELARLLKDMRPSHGTEVKFVFFAGENGDPDAGRPDAGSPDAGRPDAGNFIAYVGTLASARLVQDALSAFRAVADSPVHGLAAPAYVQGVTLSDHSSYERFGYPAVIITDTAFIRYPYYKMKDSAESPSDKPDYVGTARVVSGLAHTIAALAGAARM